MKRKTWLEKWGISGSALWVLAMIFLCLDHFGAAYMEIGVLGGATEAGLDIYSPYMAVDLMLRLFGAISFPLMAFLMVEGFHKAESFLDYVRKLLVVAIVAEIPFDLAFYRAPIYFWHQNVFFTFFVGAFVLAGLKKYRNHTVKKILVLLAGCAVSLLIRGDHGIQGMIVIAAMYLLWEKPLLQFAFCAVILLQNPLGQLSILAFLPIRLYDGTKFEKLQNAFYIFYPVHILLFYLARIIVFKT